MCLIIYIYICMYSNTCIMEQLSVLKGHIFVRVRKAVWKGAEIGRDRGHSFIKLIGNWSTREDRKRTKLNMWN